MPSIPPSVPCHQLRADSENLAYLERPLPSQANTALHIAFAAVILLRARAARFSNSQVGLTPVFLCTEHEDSDSGTAAIGLTTDELVCRGPSSILLR